MYCIGVVTVVAYYELANREELRYSSGCDRGCDNGGCSRKLQRGPCHGDGGGGGGGGGVQYHSTSKKWRVQLRRACLGMSDFEWSGSWMKGAGGSAGEEEGEGGGGRGRGRGQRDGRLPLCSVRTV